ncbi:hypothetical protein AB4562_08295 [Vibrio sp. 10N.222.54.A1]|uniref:Uncharacterized protein n=4 Tax=Vibrio TaxID=662 RepID=A0A7Z1S221_9VIBR|nr:hypothetical protein [Vibrio cyclitrophicus]PMP17674.1 hypothetical protein BCS91_25650 [Vibrio cyclitrophicus]PMP26362.1 hypothetical protein BCS90_23490 [Vibrio cyclitrophicus]
MPSITPSHDYFRACMALVLDSDIDAKISEDGAHFANLQLLIASKCAMALRLHECEDTAWWDSEVCSVDDLRSMRKKALKDDDHVAVLNITAMLAMRGASKAQ